MKTRTSQKMIVKRIQKMKMTMNKPLTKISMKKPWVNQPLLLQLKWQIMRSQKPLISLMKVITMKTLTKAMMI